MFKSEPRLAGKPAQVETWVPDPLPFGTEVSTEEPLSSEPRFQPRQ
jgi:hypothetical protein